MGEFALVVAVLAVVLVVLGAKRVPQGSEYTIERFGRYTKTLRPGLNIIVPVIDTADVRDGRIDVGDGSYEIVKYDGDALKRWARSSIIGQFAVCRKRILRHRQAAIWCSVNNRQCGAENILQVCLRTNTANGAHRRGQNAAAFADQNRLESWP